MVRPKAPLARRLRADGAGPLAMAAAYLAAASASLTFVTGSNGMAVVWPPSGILFAALLLAPARAWPRYLAAATLASLAANVGTGTPWAPTLGFTLANMIESTLGAWLVRRRTGQGPDFINPRGVGRFGLSAVLACALSASLASLVTPAPVAAFWLGWFTTNLLGTLVFAPLILIAAELRRTSGFHLTGRQATQAAAVLAMVAAVTVGTFAQTRYPLLFLPLMALLGAALRLGPFGAAAGVWIIASVGSLATSLGTGPIQLVGGGLPTQVMFLQVYLLSAFAAAMPVATLLAARDRLTARLIERNRLLGLAESVAQVGHWRLDVAAGSLFWSDEVFRIHGRAPGDPPALAQAIDAYHPDDRAMVAATVAGAIEAGAPFVLPARLVLPSGEVRHVLSRAEVERDASGKVAGVFGVFMDITQQVVSERALDQARLTAEDAARHATILAETDQLTGLANRRKAMHLVDAAIVGAGAGQVAVALFDIDHFKRVNDTFGHAVGDAVLRRVAADAVAALRGDDLVGRIGGEEFVLLLRDADAARAVEIAERVRRAIEAGGRGTDLDPKVSASFGVALLRDGEGPDLLLGRADRALYEAKRAGRNVLRLAA